MLVNLIRFVIIYYKSTHDKCPLNLRNPLMPTPLTVRQRRGAAGSSFFSLPAVYPAGLWHRERGGVQDAETHLQKHPGRWISQHTSQTGCECLILSVAEQYIFMTLEECTVDRLRNRSHTVAATNVVYL